APRSHSTELVNKEVLAIGAQERAGSALARVGRRKDALLQQAREITLGQVERLIRSVALSPDECVDGIPVSGTEFGQGRAGLGRSRRSRSDDEAPVSRRKPSRGAGVWVGIMGHDDSPSGSDVVPFVL